MERRCGQNGLELGIETMRNMQGLVNAQGGLEACNVQEMFNVGNDQWFQAIEFMISADFVLVVLVLCLVFMSCRFSCFQRRHKCSARTQVAELDPQPPHIQILFGECARWWQCCTGLHLAEMIREQRFQAVRIEDVSNCL